MICIKTEVKVVFGEGDLNNIKNFLEDEVLNYIKTRIEDRETDSLDFDGLDYIQTVTKHFNNKIKSLTEQNLYPAVEDGEFGEIGISCFKDFLEDYGEWVLKQVK